MRNTFDGLGRRMASYEEGNALDPLLGNEGEDLVCCSLIADHSLA